MSTNRFENQVAVVTGTGRTDREGLIPQASVERLEEIGKGMDANGESIYRLICNIKSKKTAKTKNGFLDRRIYRINESGFRKRRTPQNDPIGFTLIPQMGKPCPSLGNRLDGFPKLTLWADAGFLYLAASLLTKIP